MVSKILKVLQEFKEANYSFRDVTIYSLMIVVSLGGFYLYRLIDTLEFKYEQLETATERTISDMFSIHIGIPYSAIQEPIRDAAVLYKDRVRADWVLLLGVHNGDVFGPFHLKKLSLIEEVKSEGLESQLGRFQSIPVNLYQNFEVFSENRDTVLISNYETLREEDRYRFPALGWREYGINNYVAAPIYETTPEETSRLVGIIGFYYRRGASSFLADNEQYVRSQIRVLKEIVESEIDHTLENDNLPPVNNED